MRKKKKAFFINKRADYKYWWIASLILGLIVLAIISVFLFREYFTQEDFDYETCRQSVILRNNMIIKNGGVLSNLASELIPKYPFKCKTKVVEIDYKNDVERVLKTLADEAASCYYLYGEDKYVLYTKNYLAAQRACFICSRIHFRSDVVNDYTKLDLGKYLLNEKFNGEETYFDYLWGDRFDKLKEMGAFKPSALQWISANIGQLLGIVPKGGSIPTTKEELKNKVLNYSTFNARKGDIFIVNTFLISNILGEDSVTTGVHIFQPSVHPEALKRCDKIETIPA